MKTGNRIKDAVSDLPRLMAFSLGWGVVMALSAVVALKLDQGFLGGNWRAVTLLFLLGGLVAGAPSIAAARILAASAGAETRFAAAFLTLSMLTIGITAGLFALDYRSFYAQWHAEPFSKIWVIQFVYTCAGAVYQFAVTGLRLYLPVGLAALVAASLWFARARH